jgi:DNA-binding NtrC family response regulator
MMQRVAISVARIPADEHDSSGMSKELSRLKVLVVDDEPLIRWAVAEMLGDCGCQVIQAADGRSAVLAINESAPFDVVLLDVRLPDCDDLTLLMRIKSMAPAARIIVMTAHGTPEMAAHALDLGAFSFVNKPFEMADLATLVSQNRHDN